MIPRSHGKFISVFIGLGIMLILVMLVCGCTQQIPLTGTQTPKATQTSVGMANPASISCEQAGGTVEIKKDTSGNEYGMCTFKNGTSCEEWGLFRNEGCQPSSTVIPTVEGKK